MQGQLRTEQDLQLAVAGAEMEINHFTITDGSTPMERAGLRPMSSKELVAPTEWQMSIGSMTAEEVLERVRDVDEAAVAEAMRERCETLQGMHRINKDKRARYNLANRVAVNERKHGYDFVHANEGMVKGTTVDWEGALWKYLDHEGPPGRITKIQLEKLKAPGKGVRKWAMLAEVRPVAIGREELDLPRDATGECAVLDTVAYEWGGEIHLGVVLVIDMEANRVRVHVLEHKQGKAGITYIQNWTGGPGGKADRRMENCPDGYTADVREVERAAVFGRVTVQGNHRLTEESLRYLESLGVDTFNNGR
jgi:hypothetical protein